MDVLSELQSVTEAERIVQAYAGGYQRGRSSGLEARNALLSRRKNASASNWEFGLKKSEYFQRGSVAPFALTSQVLNESEWTPAVLKRRQQELIGAPRREWRLD